MSQFVCESCESEFTRRTNTHFCSLMCRFLAKVNLGDPADCWEWTAFRDGNGYGRLQIDGLAAKAHRVSYELSVGPIPDALPLDHLCRNPPCVNPDHLEPVTHRENILRGVGMGAINARRTHCAHGHEFNDENTLVTKQGNRACRPCNTESTRVRRAKRRKNQESI
jgi:hypothetical protein